MKYTVVLEREADGGFVASVPILPGCVSQGDSREEALENIQEAIDLYVEDCRIEERRLLSTRRREDAEITAEKTSPDNH
jgi:predicted RNase H-like HicB family nuclease